MRPWMIVCELTQGTMYVKFKFVKVRLVVMIANAPCDEKVWIRKKDFSVY